MKFNIQLNEKQKKTLLRTLSTLGAATILAGFMVLPSSCNDPAPPPDSTSSSSAPAPNPYPDTYPQVCQNGQPCSFGDWKMVEDPDCTHDGAKSRICKNDSSHIDYEILDARGHSFGDIGICSVCEAEAKIPSGSQNPYYNDVTDGYSGHGNPYDRYLLEADDYFTATLGNSEIWFEFGVEEAGQYAVITTSIQNAKIERFDASEQWISDKGHEARTLPDGNLLSTITCSKAEWSAHWKATYCISGTPGSVVKFRIVRLADAPWAPSNIINDVFATETKPLTEDVSGLTMVEVPYSSAYYYDEQSGYYRLGSESKPGAIIYAAITANATRLFGETSFVGNPNSSLAPPNLKVNVGTTIEGDTLFNNYVPFLYDAENGGSNKGYANFVNKDGLYPVTQELKEFLTLYTTGKVSVPADSSANAWLAPCYYYANINPGTESNPYVVTEYGTFTVDITESNYDYIIYYKLKIAEEQGPNTTTLRLTVQQDNVKIIINNVHYMNYGDRTDLKDTVEIEYNPSQGLSLQIINLDFDNTNADINVTIAAREGSYNNPIKLNTGNVVLQPIATLNNQAYYEYIVEVDGTLTLTTDSQEIITVNNQNTELNQTSGKMEATVEVTQGETIIIYVSAENTEAIGATLTFTAATNA